MKTNKFCLIITAILLGGLTMAQESETSQNDESTQKTPLELELEEATLKAKIAEQKKLEKEYMKETRAMNLPKSETKGMEGKIIINEGAGYYAEILAYKAMDSATARIAKNVIAKNETDPFILLIEEDLAENAVLWNIIKIKLEAMTQALQKTLGLYPNRGAKYSIKNVESVGAILAAAPAILGFAADIGAFFRTDRTITPKTIVIQEQALIASMAKSLQSEDDKIKVIMPRRDLSGEGTLYKMLLRLIKLRDEVIATKEAMVVNTTKELSTESEVSSMYKTKRSVLIKQIDNAINSGKTIKPLLAQLEDVDIKINNATLSERKHNAVITQIDTEIKCANDLIKAITEKSGESLSPLESVSTIERIKRFENSKLLYLSMVSQGGEIETAKGAFSQGTITYLGGNVICYILTDKTGNYINSGNEAVIRTTRIKRSKEIPVLED